MRELFSARLTNKWSKIDLVHCCALSLRKSKLVLVPTIVWRLSNKVVKQVPLSIFIIYHLVWPCWIQLQGLVRKQKVNKAVNQLPVPSLQLTLGQTWLDTSRRMDIFDTRCVAASWRIWNANHCKPRSVMICAQSTWEVWGATTAKPDALETKKNLQTEVTLKACHDMSDLMVLLTGLPLQN